MEREATLPYAIQVDAGGGMTLPPEVWARIGATPGSTVVVLTTTGGMRITTVERFESGSRSAHAG